MEEGFPFHFPVSASLISLFNVLVYLLDVALDVWTIVALYHERDYVYMGVLIALLLFSSILVNTFSWIWYSDTETSVDKFVTKYHLLGPLHFVLLGVFLRMASLMELSIAKLQKTNDLFQEGVAAHLKHDLSILRLFETFSESVPQLVLMIVIKLTQEQELQLVTGVKIAGSFISVAMSVLFFHRDMRDFAPKKQKMGWSGSIVYFLWNLLLITSRVVAIALFASILPCYIALHFLCLWLLFFLWAWREKTDFMEIPEGENSQKEWLFRATVGLIWYFSWFNVSSGQTRVKSNIYHACMGADMALLLGLWFWRRSIESAHLGPSPVNLYVMIITLPLLYLIGILIKLLYYWKFHPNLTASQVTIQDKKDKPKAMLCRVAAADAVIDVNLVTDSFEAVAQPAISSANKRMRNMAVNFYS
ncbi:XK-related protein 8-like [Hoplias malabaricus]|uniref:XK-related protein 8-like n=1 Tax=Hoplias malabaricus TaxID=27720 RepID=UPI0034622828